MINVSKKSRLPIVFLLTVTLSGCAPDETSPDANGTTARHTFAQDMVNCLSERGWDVVATSDTGYTVPDGIPDAQWQHFESDENHCRTAHGYDQPPPPLSQEEAARLYEELVGVAACIEDLGYPVERPPSEQAFVDAVINMSNPPWHPYDVLADLDSLSDIDQIRDECPVSFSQTR